MTWGAVMRPVPLLATKKRQNSEHLFRLSPLRVTFWISPTVFINSNVYFYTLKLMLSTYGHPLSGIG